MLPDLCICYETDSFTSTVTEETYKINHKFDSTEKCLIYSFTGNKCKKQHVVKQLTLFTTRRITDLTLANMRIAYYACKNTCTIITITMTSQ